LVKLADLQTILNAPHPTPGMGLVLDYNGQLPQAVVQTLPGYEIAYVEMPASAAGDVNVTSTTQATPTSVLALPAVTFDGQTTIYVEYFPGRGAQAANVAGNILVLDLWDGATNLGDMLDVATSTATAPILPIGVAKRKLRPSVGPHTFTIQGWLTGAGTGVVYGRGDAGYLPGYLRLVRA
jgi:hypothetical protein